MARTHDFWESGAGGTYIKTIGTAGYDILINGTNKYINFNTDVGSSGYGFRDNAGTIEFKNSGGAWTAIGSGGGSSPLTTKGDLYTFSTVDARLPVGTNGYVLTADSAEATGLKWSANGSGTVTSVAMTVPTGLTISGSPVTTTGTLAVALDTGYVIPLQSTIDGKVTANGAITGATKTKITYDAKGLVTAGADATTADIADSTNRRYVTDAQLVVIGNTSGTNTGDQTSIVGITGTKAQFDTAVTDGNLLYVGDITQYTDEMAQDAVGGMVANSTFVNLAYVDGTPSLTASLSATGTPSASTFLRGDNTWATPAGSGDVSKVGTPANNQMAVWTGDGTLEGTSDFTYDGTNLNLITGKNFQIAGGTVLSDSSGTLTLSGIDALDATTEATIESAIDTLANLTSIQGQTVTLAGAFITSGANSLTLTTTGATNVTLPTTGTLATTSQLHDAVTVSGAYDYITLSGQDIVRGQIDLSTDVTGDLPFSNIEQVATNRIMGRATAGTGDMEALTASSARTVLGLSSSDSPQFTAIELGHATDTTISRVSAGVIAVEGVNILTTATGQPLDSTLTALASYNTNGILTQTAADTFTGRTITGTANQITVTNGDGVSGNPTLSLPSDVIIPTVVTVPNTGLHILDTNASHDLIVSAGSDLTADRTLTVTTGDTNMILDLTAVTDEYVLAYDSGTNTWRGVAGGAGGGANTALSNLASVAINTTLVSDTTNTDDLGTSSVLWRTGYFGTSIELGHASDTTLTRSSAGVLAVEGVVVPTETSTNTLTNKTLTNPTINAATISGDFQVDATPNTDDTFNGQSTNTFNAGATIAQWEAVYLDSSSTWQLADADSVTTGGSVLIALASEAGTAGNPLRVVDNVTYVRNDAWSWTVGGVIYLSTTAGGLTQTAPSGTDDVVKILGHAVTATVMRWNPSSEWLTVN